MQRRFRLYWGDGPSRSASSSIDVYKRQGDSDFEVIPSVIDLLENRDFGRYAAEDGNMNVCFISDNDITGGNSGSGMFNGNGELIGLAFDGNWEAMSSDIIYEPNLPVSYTHLGLRG